MAKRLPRWDRLDKSSIPLQAVVDEYLAVCRTEGKTESTLRGYRSELRRFNRWLEEGTLGDLTLQTARAYIESLQGTSTYDNHPMRLPRTQPISPTTLKGRAMVLKGFATWLYEENYTAANVLARFQPPKAPRKLMVTLSADEVKRLVDYIDTSTMLGARNLAMVLLFLDTGLRSAELLGLRRDNLHLDDRCLKVMGKGQKERIVPFGDRTARALMRYLTLRQNPQGHPVVFLNQDYQPLSEVAIRLIFSRLAKAVGIERLHIHLLRHTFATNYLLASGDPFSLQRILGHETLEMTRRYVDMVRLQDITRQRGFSPVDRMGFTQRRWHKGKESW